MKVKRSFEFQVLEMPPVVWREVVFSQVSEPPTSEVTMKTVMIDQRKLCAAMKIKM